MPDETRDADRPVAPAAEDAPTPEAPADDEGTAPAGAGAAEAAAEAADEAAALPLKALRYKMIAQQFRDLGIARMEADLQHGRITWLDRAGMAVAEGRCLAILSHAAANDSVAWAGAIPGYVEAGVPCVEPPPGTMPYREGVTLEQAEQLAQEAAGRTEAMFYESVAAGEGMTLFLAVTEFTVIGEAPAGELPEA